jgi:hypothetical protein
MSNETKQTAVAWQAIELMRINLEYSTNKITSIEFQEQIKYTLEKAKEMYDEQMIGFGTKCLQSQKETYGGKQRSNNKHSSIDLMFNRAISVLPIDAFYGRQRLKETYEQAKAMHKEEIENGWYDGYLYEGRIPDHECVADIYYKKTYGGNK